MIFRKTATTHSCFTLKVSIETKVIHHDIIMILVTTKMIEKSLKKLLPWLHKNSAINTQVKDHIPLRKQQKNRNTGSIKI